MSKNKTSAAQLRAAKKYRQEKLNRFTVNFSPVDSELWEHIQNQPNKQGYIKALIRADMEPPKPCDFCARFDFDSAKATTDRYGAHIKLACAATKYPVHEQFNFCPVCGRPLKGGAENADD